MLRRTHWAWALCAVLAAPACEKTTTETRAGESANRQVEEAQKRAESAFDRAKNAQEEARKEQQDVERAEAKVGEEQKDVEEAQAKAAKEGAEAQQAQAKASAEGTQASQVASESQKQATEARAQAGRDHAQAVTERTAVETAEARRREAETRMGAETAETQPVSGKEAVPVPVPTPTPAPAASAGATATQTAIGVVSEARSDAVVIERKGAAPLRVRVDALTPVLMQGKQTTTHDLWAGTQVTVTYRTDGEHAIAERIEVTNPSVP